MFFGQPSDIKPTDDCFCSFFITTGYKYFQQNKEELFLLKKIRYFYSLSLTDDEKTYYNVHKLNSIIGKENKS
jgi:hypothetical protein